MTSIFFLSIAGKQRVSRFEAAMDVGILCRRRQVMALENKDRRIQKGCLDSISFGFKLAFKSDIHDFSRQQILPRS